MPPNNGRAKKLDKLSAAKEAGANQDDDLAQTENRFYEQEAKAINEQNLGWLGGIFGSKANASTNINGLSTAIAGLVTILCVIEIFYLLNSSGASSVNLITAPSSIASLALGYMFGKSGK